MVDFWLDNPLGLFSIDNFKFDNTSDDYIRILNLVAIASIIIFISLVFITKKPIYFAFLIIILSFTVLVKSNIKDNFSPTGLQSGNVITTSFDTNAKLVKNALKDDNKLYINISLNFNKGDVISLTDYNNNLQETHIVSDILYTNQTQQPVIILLNALESTFQKETTKIMKVSDTSPNIISPPDGNRSIQMSNNLPFVHPANYTGLNNNRYDWNLELPTMGGLQPGQPPTYNYQGQPYGQLKCRESTVHNPMGVINIPDYDAPPTMFGTCNVADANTLMTTNQEATVSQRVNDLLFHRGNSQSLFTPMPVDTMPNSQDAFANFCYRSPDNLVNPKYASIFVNDPEKFKLVTKLAKATGTENGGG
jgi:hypothetical protein